MSFSTVADFYLYGMREQACSALGSDTAAREAVISAGLEQAYELMCGYFRSAEIDLPLPEASVTSQIKSVECRVATWEIFSVRSEPNSEGFEVLQYKYEDAIKWLQNVAKGVIQPLPVDESGNPIDEDPSSASSGAAAVVSDTSRNWGACV